MTDVFSKEKRSEIMSKIRSKNTKIEKVIFRELRKNGIYFQKHYKRALGCPDIAFPKKKKAIFIDGTFWHGYKFLKLKNRLTEYWKNKIQGNIRRDIKNRKLLKNEGWKVLRLWEHEIEKKNEKTIQKIIKFLNN